MAGRLCPIIWCIENGRYTMDFADLAQKAADPAVKMAILCSPHNPVSRVWTKEELTQFGQICLDNDVLVISDEIHCDLILPGHNFTSFASLGEEFEQKSIVCTAPSKTFNLAGLHTSNIIIPDETMREKVKQTMEKQRMPGANPFGLVATEAAYKEGEDWLAAVMDLRRRQLHFPGNVSGRTSAANETDPARRDLSALGGLSRVGA